MSKFIKLVPSVDTEEHFYTKLIARTALRIGVAKTTSILGNKAVDALLPDHNNEDVEDTKVDFAASVAVKVAPALTVYASDLLVFPHLCTLIDRTYDFAEAKKIQRIEKKEEKETKTESTSTK